MSDDSFHLETLGRPSDRERNTVLKLPRVDWTVTLLALAGVATVAWIGFLLWAAFELLERSLS